MKRPWRFKGVSDGGLFCGRKELRPKTTGVEKVVSPVVELYGRNLKHRGRNENNPDLWNYARFTRNRGLSKMLLNTLNISDSRRLFYHNGAVPEFHLSPSVAVSKIKGKGLGMVATARIEESEIIECCPVLVLRPCKQLNTNWRRLHRVMLETVFSDHHFWWDSKYGAMPLGYGCLYNHSADPNAEVFRFIRERKMAFVANQCIEEGEEISHKYRHVWFEPLDTGVCPGPVAADPR